MIDAPLALAFTAGFVVVFGVVGTAVTQLPRSVQGFTPWLTIVLGAVLVARGLAIFKGCQPSDRPRRRTGSAGAGG